MDSITKTENRIVFLNEWIEDLKKDNSFESRNKIFQLQTEIDSRTMFLKTLKRDLAFKKMNEELPILVEQIEKSKLPSELASKFDGLKKRVKIDKYANIQHKAHDYELASQMVQYK